MRNRILSTILLALLLGSTVFSAITLVKGQAETHDLEVFLEDTLTAPHHLSSGDSAVLNATVVNNGNATEYNVNLQLLINNTVYFSSTTPVLSPYDIFWTAYPWSPGDGIWNLTVYSPLLASGESNTANNVRTRLVNVSADEAPYVNFTCHPVNPPPNPRPLVNKNVTFNASSSRDPDWGNITEFTWDFDDGEYGTGEIVNHSYDVHGEYNVTLVVVDTENMTSNKTELVKVYAPPIAETFTISDGFFAGHPLTFNASSSCDPDNDTGPPTHGIAIYTWDFGDGNRTVVGDDEPPTPSIVHTYTVDGIYTANLTVTDSHNLSDSWARNIAIGIGYPTATFEIMETPPYFVNTSLTFNASSSFDVNGGAIINYTWNFDDGTPIHVGEVVTHNFTHAGTYNVTLIVTDDEGLNDTETRPVDVVLQIYLRVEPNTIATDHGDMFSVNITIANVEDLKSFDFYLVWPPRWLPPEYYLIDYFTTSEGAFLGPQKINGTDRWVRHAGTGGEGEGNVSIGYSFTDFVPREERSGNGTLVTIHFTVISSGNATLSFEEVELFNSEGMIPSDHLKVEDGYLYTNTPVAQFTWSKPAVPGQNVTFDASSSYDPNNDTGPPTHGIANYTWDFGDTSPPKTTSNPIINHTYDSLGIYAVNLNVTDYEGKTWWIQNHTVLGTRDIAVIDVEPSPFAFNATLGAYENNGALQIDVTVKNNGTFQETFNVTVYADGEVLGEFQNEPLEPGDNTTLTFELYAFYSSAGPGIPKGNYTIVATVSPLDWEQNIENNNMTADEEVIVYLAGDVNCDDEVDIFDALRMSAAFDSSPGDSNWDPHADLNNDGTVNVFDAISLSSAFGKSAP